MALNTRSANLLRTLPRAHQYLTSCSVARKGEQRGIVEGVPDFDRLHPLGWPAFSTFVTDECCRAFCDAGKIGPKRTSSARRHAAVRYANADIGVELRELLGWMLGQRTKLPFLSPPRCSICLTLRPETTFLNYLFVAFFAPSGSDGDCGACRRNWRAGFGIEHEHERNRF